MTLRVIHSFRGYFSCGSSSPLLLRGAPRLQHWYCVGVNTPKRYRQLQEKDLPKVSLVTPRVWLQPAILRMQGTELTTEPQRPTRARISIAITKVASPYFLSLHCLRILKLVNKSTCLYKPELEYCINSVLCLSLCIFGGFFDRNGLQLCLFLQGEWILYNNLNCWMINIIIGSSRAVSGTQSLYSHFFTVIGFHEY